MTAKIESKIKPKKLSPDQIKSSLATMKLLEVFMKSDPETQRMIGKLLKKKKGGLVRKK